MPVDLDLHLPRNAFTPRDAARAGDVWRACQDVAVLGASALGWPPQRFRAEGAAFVVRQMTVVHRAEARYGQRISGHTWISSFRRGLLCDRQIRLSADGAPLAEATQQWAHVSTATGSIRAARASEAIVADFPVEGPADEVAFPSFAPVVGAPVHTFTFRCWHTWMDPLAHANHPSYVDWAEEALARVVAAASLDPVNVQPVAESARWHRGVVADEEVRVVTRLIGRTADRAVVCDHAIRAPGGLAATVRTARRMIDGRTDALAAALEA